RILADKIKEKLSSVVIVLGSANKQQKKAFLVIAVTPDLLSKNIDAGVLICQLAPLIGGSGGGRQDFAQAGGTNLNNFTLVFEKLKDIINS
ncbi:MAG: DHHA1 domain-containing protein, partial [Candidatus Omnitrophota bacterium]|nr:DHHA1 domain-containing protein [Candidatus Omnitrophota bacterium]